MDDDVTSGSAVCIGEFINAAKNMEDYVDYWYNNLAETACECKIVIPDPGDDYDKIGMQLETIGKPWVILENAFDEWCEQLPLLARKYNIPIKEIELNYANNMEAQNIIEGN